MIRHLDRNHHQVDLRSNDQRLMCVKGEISAQPASGRVRTFHTSCADGADLERIERPQCRDVRNSAPTSIGTGADDADADPGVC
ncbi:hypothetical protein D3C71_1537600 [compost metagenome]